jgi:hypothetical protein
VAVTPHTIGMTQNQSQPPGRDLNSNLTIVGTKDVTQVTVRVTANTAAGGAIAAMTKAQTQTFTLTAYDVLQLASTDLGSTYIECTTSPFPGIGGRVCRIDNDLTGTIVTSDKPFSAWGEIFGDEVTAAAMIDRLVHHAEILALKGDSYRLRGKPRPPESSEGPESASGGE